MNPNPGLILVAGLLLMGCQQSGSNPSQTAPTAKPDQPKAKAEPAPDLQFARHPVFALRFSGQPAGPKDVDRCGPIPFGVSLADWPKGPRKIGGRPDQSLVDWPTREGVPFEHVCTLSASLLGVQTEVDWAALAIFYSPNDSLEIRVLRLSQEDLARGVPDVRAKAPGWDPGWWTDSPKHPLLIQQSGLLTNRQWEKTVKVSKGARLPLSQADLAILEKASLADETALDGAERTRYEQILDGPSGSNCVVGGACMLLHKKPPEGMRCLASIPPDSKHFSLVQYPYYLHLFWSEGSGEIQAVLEE